MASDKTKAMKFQKSYFDVLGLCCSSEVPLIEKILKPLEGIEKVSVIVPTRTVIVVHDNLLISQIQIVKALNQARLEANVQVFGEKKSRKMWPSPYTMASGILLALSFFKFLFNPLHWLALGAAVVGLPPILMRSIAAVQRLTLDINILVLIAAAGTIAMRDYWEAASIVFLFTIAEWLESRASHKATAVMSMLMSMAPQKAVLAENGHIVDAIDVKVNTVIAVKAGEVIPIDGIVVEGKSEVDERTLTGESFPVAKQTQSSVWAGTINLNGYISVKTTALAEDSAVARMAKLVEEAQHSKSKTQRLIDKCAKYYTPAVVLLSTGLAVVPTALRVHNVKHWYHLALVLLVSACPCALVLSTPIATFCALTKAATVGLLIKGGDYLEALAKIKIMAFDKTGTITRGEFTLTDFRSLSPDDVTFHMLLYWVSSIESKSSHPMAAALVDYGRSHGVDPKPENVEEFQIFPGEGIYGEIDGKYIYIGNKRIAARAGCETVPSMEEKKEGVTVGYIFSGATPIGFFSLSDTCRSGVLEAINELKSLGLKTAMLTGDSRGAAMHIQDQLGHALGIVYAELLPEEKVQIIKELKKEGPTAMVGDGMNDAPALATADVGISMGIVGSAVATETGHVTLMSNDIRKIPQAIRLSRMTRQKIIENVCLSIVTKVAILALAFSGHPILWAAVLADVGTCLLVIFNSMFILRGTSTQGPTCTKSSHAQPHTHSHRHGPHVCCGPSTRVEHANGTCASVDSHAQPHTHKHGPHVCCGPSTRVERANATCASANCHLTRVHRRSCAPSTCGSDRHGSCASISTCAHAHVHKEEECNHEKHIEGGDSIAAACATHDHTCDHGTNTSPTSGPCHSHACLGPATHVKRASHEHSISICESETSHLCHESEPHIHEDAAGRHRSTDHDHCSHGEDGVHVEDVHGTCEEHSSGNDPTHAAHVHTCHETTVSSHVCVDLESREDGGSCKRKDVTGHLSQIVID